MKHFLVAILAAILAAGCSTGSTGQTYTLADGRTYKQTDCPAAANLLVGGHDAADALPKKGQTDRERVEELHDQVAQHLTTSGDAVQVKVIPRSGEVWYWLEDGGYAVEQISDYQYEALLAPDGACPSTPYSIEGIPVLYNRVDR